MCVATQTFSSQVSVFRNHTRPLPLHDGVGGRFPFGRLTGAPDGSSQQSSTVLHATVLTVRAGG